MRLAVAVAVAARGRDGAEAAARDDERGGVPAAPPAHDLQASGGRLRHGQYSGHVNLFAAVSIK